MEEKLLVNYENMFDYVKNTVEYLFIDKAEVIPGKEARGVKLASSQDWYFKLHFPGNPIMPGVFVMEAIMTTGSLIVYSMPEKKNIQLLFNGCEEAKFFGSIRPGDTMETHVVLDRYRYGVARFSGEAFRDGTRICQMRFTLIAPEEFPRREEGNG